MSIDYDRINKMSSDGTQTSAPRYQLNQIEFNGQKGTFVERMLLGEKSGDGKYEKRDLGQEVKCVFLKHRRVLSQYVKDGKSLNTNEHKGKDDYVFLSGANEKGIASNLREKYQKLRVKQIVYAYVPSLGEVVRIVIKGKSLFSEDKNRFGYYDYVSSFEKGDHAWMYWTELKPVQMQGELGSYYAMELVKGEKLTDGQMEKIAGLIEEVTVKMDVVEEYYKAKAPQELAKAVEQEDEEIDDGSTSDESINIADIPF